jgi:hypothetical protein
MKWRQRGRKSVSTCATRPAGRGAGQARLPHAGQPKGMTACCHCAVNNARRALLSCGYRARGGIRTLDLPITSRMLGVGLDGSRRIWPAYVGWLVGPDGSRRIQKDRLDDQTDDQGVSDRESDGKASKGGSSPATTRARPPAQGRVPQLAALSRCLTTRGGSAGSLDLAEMRSRPGVRSGREKDRPAKGVGSSSPRCAVWRRRHPGWRCGAWSPAWIRSSR